MKHCNFCDLDLPLEMFTRRPGGQQNGAKCRSCLAAYQRARRQTEEGREVKRRHARSQKGLEGNRRRNRAYYLRHRDALLEKVKVASSDQKRAQVTLQVAVRAGRIQRGRCEICGSSKTDAHHDDYTKPLDVRWLCRLHHVEHHREAVCR